MDRLLQLNSALAGRYAFARELGSGGMATVYLAEDVRHHRNVAIKVLHPELTAVIGAERFLKEIALTANLQHPHILPLFDSGDAGGLLYYVMPFVDGETLRARLEREHQLPIADALRIAIEIADALEYAHRRGVVHRDVKPENILLQDGRALVADFGIALAVQQAGGGERLTQTGLSLGTPQYMAPEQAMGERSIDARADTYALGAVTYEMLVGEPPFTGPTAQSIIARILTEEPRALVSQRHTVPPDVEAAVLKALEKLPADRFSSTTAFGAALRLPAFEQRGVPRTASSRWRFGRAAVTGTVLVLVGASAFMLGDRRARRASLGVRFGASVKVTADPGLEIQPAISPDGRFVAYAAGTTARMRIFVRQIAGGRTAALTDDSLAVQTNPVWSADGARILFLANRGIFSAPSSGGAAQPELPAPGAGVVSSADWTSDGLTIAYSVADSLYIRSSTRAIRAVGRIPDASLCRWSPNATLIACTSGNAYHSTVGLFFGNLSPSRIVVARISDGTTTTVTDSSSLNQSPVWSADGTSLDIVSDRHGLHDIYRIPLDGKGRARGPGERLTTGLNAHTISQSSDGSRLAYSVLSATANVWSLPFPTNPPVSSAGAVQVTFGEQVIENATSTMDGKWLYYDSNQRGKSDLYRMRLPAGRPERLTSDSSDDFSPDPSPDGREVAFHSWRSGSRDVYVMSLEGRALQRVTFSPRQEAKAMWSPDGRAIAFTDISPSHGTWVVRRDAAGHWLNPVQRVPGGNWHAWSPDGRFLSYTARVTGGSLYVVPVDSGPSRLVVDETAPGGLHAGQSQWSRDGRTLFFKSHDEHGNASFWSVPVEGGIPRLLVRFDDPSRPSYRPEWGLTAGRMYFTVEDRQSTIHVMNVLPR